MGVFKLGSLEVVYKKLGLLDLIFIVPMFLLFSYLPDYSPWNVLLNVVIVLFFSFGLAMAFHIVFDLVKGNKG